MDLASFIKGECMKIAIIGTGYVGLTTGTCLANLGNDIICVDIDKEKTIKLNNGEVPFFEPGLEEMMLRNFNEKRMSFTTDSKLAVLNSEIIFLCVGTPQKEDGEADLNYVYAAAKTIGQHINSYKIIVNKSTVPVGTAAEVKDIIGKELQKRNVKLDFDVISNPEFLREGQAIYDFLHPDRVVIGVESDKAKQVMYKLYKVLERSDKPIMFCDVKTAELIKYASNSMLATRISFVNMLSHLCEKTGADIKAVAKGMGLDNRIGPRFLQAGAGYGGSCFPKDVKALVKTLRKHGCDASILEAVDSINEMQKKSLLPKCRKLLGSIKGKRVAVFGLSFKPKTDDMREAPSLVLIEQLQKEGADIIAFDPVAQENASKLVKIEFGKEPYDTVKDADLLVMVTEWDEFRQLDFEKIKKLMKQPNIVDGRNVYDMKEMRELGFNYIGVGR